VHDNAYSYASITQCFSSRRCRDACFAWALIFRLVENQYLDPRHETGKSMEKQVVYKAFGSAFTPLRSKGWRND